MPLGPTGPHPTLGNGPSGCMSLRNKGPSCVGDTFLPSSEIQAANKQPFVTRLSLSMSSRLIHVVAGVRMSFLLKSE